MGIIRKRIQSNELETIPSKNKRGKETLKNGAKTLDLSDTLSQTHPKIRDPKIPPISYKLTKTPSI